MALDVKLQGIDKFSERSTNLTIMAYNVHEKITETQLKSENSSDSSFDPVKAAILERNKGLDRTRLVSMSTPTSPMGSRLTRMGDTNVAKALSKIKQK